MQQGMDAARKANQPIKQNWLDLKLFCMDQMGDTKGVADMRMQLVRQYPTHEHWDALLTTLRQQQDNDDTTTLNSYMGRNVRADGRPIPAEPEIWSESFALQPGDSVLLCTDGLYKELSPADIGRHLALRDPAKACRGLMRQALGGICNDNISVVVVKFGVA